jgi:hypothetical protein
MFFFGWIYGCFCQLVDHPNADPAAILPDGRFNHLQQVNDRLRFLRFLLKDGQLWLCKPQANEASYQSILLVCFTDYSFQH